MDGLEGLAAMMAARGGMDMKPISVAELDKGFDPIADLKPGEKIQWKGAGYKNGKTPNIGTAIIVHRVGDFNLNAENNGAQVIRDFTALFIDGSDGEIIEFAFDSRRFERVTE